LVKPAYLAPVIIGGWKSLAIDVHRSTDRCAE